MSRGKKYNDVVLETGKVKVKPGRPTGVVRSTGVVEVKLNGKFANRKYASPHIVDVKGGDEIKFTVVDNSIFWILIDNRDGFFGGKPTVPVELKVDNSHPQTTPIITKIIKGEEKYYSVYNETEGKYANHPYCSPPKIVGM